MDIWSVLDVTIVHCQVRVVQSLQNITLFYGYLLGFDVDIFFLKEFTYILGQIRKSILEPE